MKESGYEHGIQKFYGIQEFHRRQKLWGCEEFRRKKRFFARLKEGLNKTRNNIVNGIDSVFNGFSAIDDEFYEELEEILIMGDIGVNATSDILQRLKKQVKEQHIKEPAACKQLLIDSIREQMQVGETAYDFEKSSRSFWL